MSLDYDLFIIDSGNKNTEEFQLRSCIKDAIEILDERLKKLEGNEKPTEYCPEEITFFSKLANLEIAGEDYYEPSDEDSPMVVDGKKKYFTFDEAMEIEKKVGNGWRLPTRHEWVLITEEFGIDTNTGKLNGYKLADNLSLRFNGFIYGGSLGSSGSFGYYWSSTVLSSSYAYGLHFGSGSVDPAYYYYRDYGFSVRLVREKPNSL